MAHFIYDFWTAYSIILGLFYTSFHNFTRSTAPNIHYLSTIFCYFGYMDKNGQKLFLKFAQPPSLDYFAEKLSNTEALKLHRVKENKILYQKQWKIKFCPRLHNCIRLYLPWCYIWTDYSWFNKYYHSQLFLCLILTEFIFF